LARPSHIEEKVDPPEVETFLRLKDVRGVTKLSNATIYRKMKAGQFPRSYAISEGIVVWRERDIASWQAKVLEEAIS
jgi:prophage regulatory protein